MDVVVLALVLVGLAVFVAVPLYSRATPPAPRADAVGEARREAAVRDLNDLDVDRASGLLDETDYAQERAALDRRATHDPGSRPPD
jgi:hypothetical protein